MQEDENDINLDEKQKGFLKTKEIFLKEQFLKEGIECFFY